MQRFQADFNHMIEQEKAQMDQIIRRKEANKQERDKNCLLLKRLELMKKYTRTLCNSKCQHDRKSSDLCHTPSD